MFSVRYELGFKHNRLHFVLEGLMEDFFLTKFIKLSFVRSVLLIRC
jgi:hypothetical protein